MFSKALLKTNSPGRNICGFTHRLCMFASLCWYDAICTAAASWSSSVVSRSLATTSTFAFLGISVCTMGIPIYVGMMASIQYVRANGDTPVRAENLSLARWASPTNPKLGPGWALIFWPEKTELNLARLDWLTGPNSTGSGWPDFFRAGPV